MAKPVASLKSDSGFIDNWQSGKSLADCNLHMLTYEDSCDVSFRVGKDERTVRAHRYVLISRSCVFHAMLCGPLAEKDDIKIPDADADVFLDLLKFFYTDVVVLKPGNVTGLLYLATKYAVGGLEGQCLNYLEMSLSAENACIILEQAHVFGEKQLSDRALNTIMENAERCLATQGFKELSYGCFSQVITSDAFSVKPEKVFSAAISWAEGECKRQEREISPANLRSVLGETLYSIPFQDMDQKHYVNVVVPKQMLTNEENIAIMTCLLCPEKEPAPFKRRQTQHEQKGYTDIILYDSYKQRIVRSGSENHCRWDFTFNVDVLLYGIYVLRPAKGGRNADQYNITIAHRLAFTYATLHNARHTATTDMSLQDDNIMAMYLEEPVHIVKDVTHYVYVELTSGGRQVYVGDGKRTNVTTGKCSFQGRPRVYDFATDAFIYGLIIRK